MRSASTGAAAKLAIWACAVAAHAGTAAAQEVPACAWTADPNCEAFELGPSFKVNSMGAKFCPPDSEIITDSKTCREAAAAGNVPFAGAAGEGIEEGHPCHYCNGCRPQVMRVHSKHGQLAKFVCKTIQKAAPAAPTPAVATPAEPAPKAATPAEPAPAVASTATSDTWPGCQEQNTVIRASGQALFTNLEGFGATVGCYLDDCLSSDKFVASEIESCTKVCLSIPECEYWVWGTEEGEQKCWFRSGDKGREAGEGWISGKRSCLPPGTQKLAMGNTECWAEGFGYNECCHEKHGPNGNAQCWDGVYNYDRCCFPEEEL